MFGFSLWLIPITIALTVIVMFPRQPKTNAKHSNTNYKNKNTEP